jgi:ElaB/YqjD/DUF883 family membrane-anchored ribosome-binding protein
MANTSNRGDQTGQAREQAEAAKSHLQQAGTEAKQAASSATAGIAQKAHDVASNVGDKARDVAHKAEDKADDALSSMGHRMSSMAGSLRQSAPHEGMVGSAAGAVADRLDSGGRYLQEHGVSEISDDLANVVRRNPFPALCVAFGVGFLIGMVSRR